ncbi:MAG: hybrid sensor histidine kinase/response regulator [Dehalococcoidia bacterium]|nr:hybrid sensor histidine kinase/response regulator [Dehalococcoidia bacterium]
MQNNPSLITDNSSLIRVLLIEDNPGDARLIRENLRDARAARFELTVAERLRDGLKLVKERTFDVLVLDLTLPDSSGFDTFTLALAQAPGIPIVVLTGLQDETLALRAVSEGAQDYLVKGSADGALLGRSLRYAVERHRLRQELEKANQQLEYRVRELTSLNSLFQEHLNQRFALADAYREVLDDLKKLAEETAALAKQAASQPLPDLQDISDLDPSAGDADAPGEPAP